MLLLVLEVLNIYKFLLDTNANKEKPQKNSSILNTVAVDAAMKFSQNVVMMLLNASHIKLLADTPFLHLFALPNGIQTNQAVVHQILLLWDKDNLCFKFRDVF